MPVINAIQSVISIMIMISIGYFLTYKGWFDKNTSALFSKIAVNIGLPALMVTNFVGSYDKSKLLQIGTAFLVPFGVIILSYLISIPISKMLKLPFEKLGVFRGLFTFANAIFTGLPVNIALFGEKSIPFVSLYYLANTTLFWTIGVYFIRRDAGKNSGSFFSMETLKKIINPPLIAFTASILIILLEIKLPVFVMDSVKYLGNLVTPLSMLFLGIIIYFMDKKGLRLDKPMICLMFGRFVVTPVLVFIFLHYLSVPDLMRKVFVLESSMPVMAQVAIAAQTYKADYKFATAAVTITTLSSIVVIPLYMFILTVI